MGLSKKELQRLKRQTINETKAGGRKAEAGINKTGSKIKGQMKAEIKRFMGG